MMNIHTSVMTEQKNVIYTYNADKVEQPSFTCNICSFKYINSKSLPLTEVFLIASVYIIYKLILDIKQNLHINSLFNKQVS